MLLNSQICEMVRKNTECVDINLIQDKVRRYFLVSLHWLSTSSMCHCHSQWEMCHPSLSPTYQPAAHFGSWWRSDKDASGFRLTELKLRVKLEAIPVSMWGEEAQQWESAWSCGQMGRTHFLVDSENKECFVISSDMAADDKLAHPPIPHYASCFWKQRRCHEWKSD